MRLRHEVPLHQVVERYLELAEKLDAMPASATRRRAVSGQCIRLAQRMAELAGGRTAIVTGGRVLIPVRLMERPGTSTQVAYRSFPTRDMDFESYLDFEASLIALLRRVVDRRAIEPREAEILASEVKVLTGASAAEADQVVERLPTLEASATPSDILEFKSLARVFLEQARSLPAFPRPVEDA